VVIGHIFPALVLCAKKNLATLVAITFFPLHENAVAAQNLGGNIFSRSFVSVDSAKVHGCRAGLPDFSWCNIPKRVKIYQITIKCT
jgi:hypothetical protein